MGRTGSLNTDGVRIPHFKWEGQDPSLQMRRKDLLQMGGQDLSLRMGRTGSPITDGEEMITHYRWGGQDPSLQVGRTGSLTAD
jgi:hypothetical protein